MNLSFKNKYNALLILLIIFTIISFFLGFYYDETATNGYVDLDWIKETTIFDAETNSSRKFTEKELDELYDELGNSAVEVYDCNQKEALI